MAKLITGENDLLTWCQNNGEWGQHLISGWEGVDGNGNNIEISAISYGSKKKIYWRCKIHDCLYIKTPREMTYLKAKCPLCLKEQQSIRTSARNMNIEEGINDLLTWCQNNNTGNYIIQEWTGIEVDIDGNEISHNIDIDTVRWASGRRFKFKCNQGHEYNQIIGQKTRGRQRCPFCNKNSTSYPEQLIYWGIKQLYPNTRNRYITFKDVRDRGLEFDIAIPEIKLYIEYSPTYWHKDRGHMDEIKYNTCKEKGVRLIQIIEDSFNELSTEYNENKIVFRMNEKDRDSTILNILEYILKSLDHSIYEIDIELAKENALKFSGGKIEIERSLYYIFPELVKELHSKLNNNIDCKNILPKSNIELFWHCTKCDYGLNGEWQTSVASRTTDGRESGCPSCGWNWKSQEYNRGKNRVIKNINDLSTMCTELATEWSKDYNNCESDNIAYQSNKIANWVCAKCGYGKDGEWRAKVIDRYNNKSGCPSCGWNWFIQDYKEELSKHHIITGINDLASQCAELLKEWHYELNDIDPKDIRVNSGKRAYWKCCECGYGSQGEWFVTIHQRHKSKSGCPNCGYNWYKAQTGQPQKLKKMKPRSQVKSLSEFI